MSLDPDLKKCGEPNEIPLCDIMTEIQSSDKIYVIYESGKSEGTKAYNFNTMGKCVRYFVNNKFSFEDKKGNKNYTIDSDTLFEFQGNNKNQLYIEISDGTHFIFQNKTLCKKFYKLLIKCLCEEAK